MRVHRCVLLVLVAAAFAVDARRLFLVELGKATVHKLSHLNKNAASWIQLNQKHAMAKWGEDFGFDGPAGAGDVAAESWFGPDETPTARGGNEPAYEDGDFGEPQPVGPPPGVPPVAGAGFGLGGVFQILWMAIASIVGIIGNIFIGLTGLFAQLLGVDISWIWGALLPAQTGYQQSVHHFRQLPRAQQKAIGGLFVHTITAFDTSLQQTLMKLHGHEAAIKSELQHVERLVQQPHANGDQFVQKLRQQAPKLSAVVATSFKRAAAAYRQRFARLDQSAKTGIHKITTTLKTAQAHTASVLNAAPKARKAALKQAYHLMKNAHTLTHALI
ncbi:hypothetical protein M3Y99_00159200 [Aphelenchoides fujianensis]|nr:hypothetical protein M3Y99_00159200 [Aphelenchoides fujianensis]